MKSVLLGFPGGPVVKSLPHNGGNVGSTPGRGTKIPHVKGQPSPRAATKDCVPQGKLLLTQRRQLTAK